MRYIGDTDKAQAVSAAEYRRATSVLEGDLSDDTEIDALLQAAQEAVETATGRPLAPGAYEFTVPFPGWRRWYFPCLPVTALDDLTLFETESGDAAVQDMTGVRIVRGSDEPQLLLPSDWGGFDVEADMLRIQATIGAVAGSPETRTLKRAIIMVAKQWFIDGVSVGEHDAMPQLAFGALRLIKQVRYRRPFTFCEA